MLLDMVNEDVAYIPRYAHVRGDNRENALDTFGHLAVYIDMGTVGCRDVYQILVSIATRFIFLFEVLQGRFLRLYLNLFCSWSHSVFLTGTDSCPGCSVFSFMGFSLPNTGISPTMIFLRISSFTSTFSLSCVFQFKFDNKLLRQFLQTASFQLLGRRRQQGTAEKSRFAWVISFS